MRFIDTYYDLIIVLFHICAPLTEANHGNRNGSNAFTFALLLAVTELLRSEVPHYRHDERCDKQKTCWRT